MDDRSRPDLGQRRRFARAALRLVEQRAFSSATPIDAAIVDSSRTSRVAERVLALEVLDR